MNNKTLRVALVGTGGWGYQHARVFTRRLGVELCAVCGRSPEKTRARAKLFAAHAYTDIQRMLDTERPDLVALSLPNQRHFDATMQVIEAGYPLLVEKPLVFDLAEADRLLKAAARRKLFFAINFNHRYARPAIMARKAIDQGRLGDIVFATWHFGGEGSSDHPQANLIETQCHAFDLLEHLCGPVASIACEMTDKTGGGFRTMTMALRFKSGAVGSLTGSYDSSYAYRDAHLMEINGTRGRVLIEDTVKRYTFQAAGNETAEVWEAGYFNDHDREFHRTFDAHVTAILDALRRGAQPPVHARAGRRALQLAMAAIQSHKTGKRVPVR